MAKTDYKSVEDYIQSQPQAVQEILQRVRETIRKAVPGASEVISYQIPAYKIDGRAVIYFAGWKKHYSVYPINESMQAEFKDELAKYEVSKGTVRFPLSETIPAKLIARMAKYRAKEAAEPREKKGKKG